MPFLILEKWKKNRTIVELWKHQTRSVELFKGALAQGKPGLALFHEQGTGKTRTAIECVRATAKYSSALVICPLIVCENWKRECEAAGFTASVAVGTTKQRLKALSAEADFTITNFESCRVSEFWSALNKEVFEVLIVDESHRIKNPQSQTTKAILKLARDIPWRLPLTGTPVLNSALDLYTQLSLVDDPNSPDSIGYNYFVYRSRYFYAKQTITRAATFNQWLPRPGSEIELQKVIDARSYRVLKKDCLDLPPIVRQIIAVELSPAIKGAYKELERDFITSIADTTIQTDLAITKLLRLQQLSAGIIANGEVEEFVSSPKMDALKELLETITLNHKVIVWSNFIRPVQEIARVCEALKISYVTITGGQTSTGRQAAIDAFQNDPSVKVAIANQAAGGIGINLTAASYMIYYSKNFSLEHDLQSEARCHRGGSEQHESITRIDLVCKDTVDEQINSALQSKLSLSELLLNIKSMRQ